MELHKKLTIDKTKYNLSLKDDYLTYFAKAMDFVMTYYREDFDRIASTKFSEVSPEFFFREYIWATSVSGFNAKIISNLFPKLLEAYQPLFDMVNHKVDTVNSIDVVMNALNVFNNTKKTKAVIDTAFILRDGMNRHGWATYRNTELNTPEKLEKFQMVGPVISMHLTRNIGLLNYVKPDLHLVRMAKNWNFANPIELCVAIQNKCDMPLGLIDVILFYAASTFGSKG